MYFNFKELVIEIIVWEVVKNVNRLKKGVKDMLKWCFWGDKEMNLILVYLRVYNLDIFF